MGLMHHVVCPFNENLYFTTVGSIQYKQYNNRIREEKQLIYNQKLITLRWYSLYLPTKDGHAELAWVACKVNADMYSALL